MSLLDTLVTRIGRPAGRALDPAIRDVVQAVLKEQGYASPAEVQALRDEVRDMRARVDSMQARLAEVVKLAEAARAEPRAPAAPPVDVAPLVARIAELEAGARAAAARIAELEARPAAEAAAPAPLTASAPAGCKVPGCTTVVRSKGFCSAHYQQWRRGTLDGFVGLDGHVTLDGKAYTVGAELAGSAVELRGGKVVAAG